MPRKAILLSDAEDILSALEESFLRRDGFLLLRVRTGEEAYTLAEEKDPALVILDLSLPGMHDCHRRMQEDSLLRDTPVLLVLPHGFSPEANPAGALISRPLDRRPFVQASCRLLGIATRAAPRLPAELFVTYGTTPERKEAGRTGDINAGGAFLSGTTLFPVGTPLHFVLTVGPGKEISGTGRVAWVNHPEWKKKSTLHTGMGIQFVTLEGEGGRLLRKWLSDAGFAGMEGG